MDEARKLEAAQSHFKQLRVAVMIEMAQHEQQLEEQQELQLNNSKNNSPAKALSLLCGRPLPETVPRGL